MYLNPVVILQIQIKRTVQPGILVQLCSTVSADIKKAKNVQTLCEIYVEKTLTLFYSISL